MEFIAIAAVVLLMFLPCALPMLIAWGVNKCLELRERQGKMKIKLLLIEDCIQEAEKMIEAGNELLNVKEHNHSFVIELLHGEAEEMTIGRKKYQFYNETVLDRINETIERNEDYTQVGLLLDLVLTKSELDYSKNHFVAKTDTARRILEQFSKKIPIYIVTSLANFCSISNDMMGSDLSNQYIHKQAFLYYPMWSMINKLTEFYINWKVEEV